MIPQQILAHTRLENFILIIVNFNLFFFCENFILIIINFNLFYYEIQSRLSTQS